MTPIWRGKSYHLRRRVPLRYARVEPRPEVWISLKTDSETEARSKAQAVWNETIEAWEARLRGDTDDAEARFEAARDLAYKRGYRFLPQAAVVKLPLEELLSRIEATIDKRTGKIDATEAAALLGTAERPRMPLTKALAAYWNIAEKKERGKSPDQIRRWRAPRDRAVAHFVQVCGDLDISSISEHDVHQFREWWLRRIGERRLQNDTANKDLVYLSSLFRAIKKHYGLAAANPFHDKKFDGDKKKHRKPFSTTFLRETFLKPGAFDGLNLEARCIVLGMVNTGYRPSEGAALTRNQIRLDTTIPHISIEPGVRQLKSQYSERKIPLAGVSLEAFRACPDGFPRYADAATSLSNLVNNYLRNNKLVETPTHTLYSLRHSFEDRMLRAGVDERIRRDMLGHTLNRERYGKGADLNQLHEIIQAIAL